MKRGIRFEIIFQEGAFSRLLNMLSEEAIGGIYATFVDVVNKAANEALEKAAAELLDEVAGRSGLKTEGQTADEFRRVQMQELPILGEHPAGVTDPHWHGEHGTPAFSRPPLEG